MKDIHIIYDKQENVLYSNLYHFFMICGIWVKSETLENYKKSGCKKSIVQLFLIDTDDKITKKGDNIFFAVQNPKKVDIENNVTVNDSLFIIKTLQKIDPSGSLSNAYKIYDAYNLWGCKWLFTEINCNNDPIKNIIMNQIEIFIKDNTIQNQYLDFMNLYCKYMIAALHEKCIAEQMYDIYDLLKICKNYANKYGTNDALNFLIGNIYGISKAEKRTTILFYEKIPEKERTSQLLYLIGTQYDIVYLDKEKALKYYHESYKIDHNYRSAYKIAVNTRKWKESLALYENILQKINEENQYNIITIHNLEYEYKTVAKIAEIHRKYIRNEDLNVIKKYQKRIFDKIEQGMMFDPLFNAMFKNNKKEIKQYVLDKIKKNIETIYIM